MDGELFYIGAFMVSCFLIAQLISGILRVFALRFAWLILGKKYKNTQMIGRGEIVKVGGVPYELLRDVPVYSETHNQ